MIIRETKPADIEDIMDVQRRAFGYDKEAILTLDLLSDTSAEPFLSLIAYKKDDPIGHILFTKVTLDPAQDELSLAILAPLAVVPEYQKKGIGGELIKEGLRRLRESGSDLVFVLGHPEYYPKFGFIPAGTYDLKAPYPIPKKHFDAWMVQELKKGILGKVKGTVKCAKVLDKPEHWRE